MKSGVERKEKRRGKIKSDKIGVGGEWRRGRKCREDEGKVYSGSKIGGEDGRKTEDKRGEEEEWKK